ncbi:MAG: CDP-alcohol phosphatidyltransferase family protein [Deltaproteobacteria bacterium]|nr:CDP-alcohol phosphatidyltransferase family protein [Deltaproteobacteria bacterium]
MTDPYHRMLRNTAAVLIFSRPPLVFLAFVCSLWLMFSHRPLAYILGLSLLLLAMTFDWIDGWFAERYAPHSRLGPLVDRMMDRMVLSIIFPVLGAGMLWRYARLESTMPGGVGRIQLLHALFVLSLCVIVLLRDQLAQFLRSFAIPKGEEGEEGESHELTRLRSMVFSPMAVLLYAYAFYQPTSGWEAFYRWVDWINNLPIRIWFVLEILFLAINIGSITLHLRKYGSMALEDICADNEVLRRRILSVIPNVVTLMNGFMGIVAVVFVSYGRVREAVFALLGAALLDRLDGLLARRLGLTKPLPDSERQPKFKMGALLDDISDAISFCFAPAMIFYLLFSSMPQSTLSPELVLGISVLYGLAGISRLTYFTLDKSPIPGFFKGMPVPAAALMVSGPFEVVNMLAQDNSPALMTWVYASTGLMVLAALVMNLFFVRYLHMGRLMGRHPAILRIFVVLALVLVFTDYFGLTLLAITLFYLFSPLFTWRIDPSVADRESRKP